MKDNASLWWCNVKFIYFSAVLLTLIFLCLAGFILTSVFTFQLSKETVLNFYQKMTLLNTMDRILYESQRQVSPNRANCHFQWSADMYTGIGAGLYTCRRSILITCKGLHFILTCETFSSHIMETREMDFWLANWWHLSLILGHSRGRLESETTQVQLVQVSVVQPSLVCCQG